ncbi:PID-CTERM protein-sorting domain-containing protein [Sediminitomix flava]|uniref:Uncharacterized protein n=1 Tax=Sediminitomix flava TaxID=379075 RepID=A0A315Z5Q3_SEDFL|nr:hypothetical protein [Sediminitomix flava]PWJ39238.1 hypothetical protein BC781_106139 [Sediminitomix flava]
MKLLYTIILFSILPFSSVLAQGPPPPPPIQNQAQDRPQGGGAGVPIDGGASALLAAGAAYGLNHLRKRKTDKK